MRTAIELALCMAILFGLIAILAEHAERGQVMPMGSMICCLLFFASALICVILALVGGLMGVL